MAVVGAVLLIGYPIVLSLGAAPGFPAGDLSPEGNLAGVIDRAVLGAHMWQGAGGAFDPEGLLGTFPAVATVLIGLFVGDYLREEARGVPKAIGIVAAGSLLIGTGLLWATRFPLNKALWTSSYVLYTGGWAMVTLAALHWLIDVRGWRAWSKPLVVYGV
nr:DUF5009 domain-containing protein [Akkermansiaceae bacterium]